jgi:hypothetical protein
MGENPRFTARLNNQRALLWKANDHCAEAEEFSRDKIGFDR